MRKNSKEDEQTLKELNSAYCRSQAKCQLVQTNYMKQIKLFLCLPSEANHLEACNFPYTFETMLRIIPDQWKITFQFLPI